jgi:hypothetical protein
MASILGSPRQGPVNPHHANCPPSGRALGASLSPNPTECAKDSGFYICLRGGLPIAYSFTEKYVAKHQCCWAIHLSASVAPKIP